MQNAQQADTERILQEAQHKALQLQDELLRSKREQAAADQRLREAQKSNHKLRKALTALQTEEDSILDLSDQQPISESITGLREDALPRQPSRKRLKSCKSNLQRQTTLIADADCSTGKIHPRYSSHTPELAIFDIENRPPGQKESNPQDGLYDNTE